jgi:hypothetical protein
MCLSEKERELPYVVSSYKKEEQRGALIKKPEGKRIFEKGRRPFRSQRRVEARPRD